MDGRLKVDEVFVAPAVIRHALSPEKLTIFSGAIVTITSTELRSFSDEVARVG
jgi:hypothetical protein